MLIDTFAFYNELDMLEFRLTELFDRVDYFVIVEMDKTFAGHPKPSYFDRERFAKFSDKILLNSIKCPEHLSHTNRRSFAWDRDYFQKNCVSESLSLIPGLQDDDLILVQDLDEIPDLDTVFTYGIDKLRQGMSLIQDSYYYNLYTRLLNMPNNMAKICSYGKFKNLGGFQNVRWQKPKRKRFPPIEKGGWHFSCFGDTEFISNKLKNFAHRKFDKPYWTDVEKIKNKILNGQDIVERPYVDIRIMELSDYLPKNYKMLIK